MATLVTATCVNTLVIHPISLCPAGVAGSVERNPVSEFAPAAVASRCTPQASCRPGWPPAPGWRAGTASPCASWPGRCSRPARLLASWWPGMQLPPAVPWRCRACCRPCPLPWRWRAWRVTEPAPAAAPPPPPPPTTTPPLGQLGGACSQEPGCCWPLGSPGRHRSRSALPCTSHVKEGGVNKVLQPSSGAAPQPPAPGHPRPDCRPATPLAPHTTLRWLRPAGAPAPPGHSPGHVRLLHDLAHARDVHRLAQHPPGSHLRLARQLVSPAHHTRPAAPKPRHCGDPVIPGHQAPAVACKRGHCRGSTGAAQPLARRGAAGPGSPFPPPPRLTCAWPPPPCSTRPAPAAGAGQCAA